MPSHSIELSFFQLGPSRRRGRRARLCLAARPRIGCTSPWVARWASQGCRPPSQMLAGWGLRSLAGRPHHDVTNMPITAHARIRYCRLQAAGWLHADYPGQGERLRAAARPRARDTSLEGSARRPSHVPAAAPFDRRQDGIGGFSFWLTPSRHFFSFEFASSALLHQRRRVRKVKSH